MKFQAPTKAIINAAKASKTGEINFTGDLIQGINSINHYWAYRAKVKGHHMIDYHSILVDVDMISSMDEFEWCQVDTSYEEGVTCLSFYNNNRLMSAFFAYNLNYEQENIMDDAFQPTSKNNRLISADILKEVLSLDFGTFFDMVEFDFPDNGKPVRLSLIDEMAPYLEHKVIIAPAKGKEMDRDF